MRVKIRQIQKIELDLLKQFQRICKQYKLTYFAIGGTCIGAIRHKGFIPWDDDIDVAMPYQDYKKFCAVAQKELPEKYSIYAPEQHCHWQYNFIKLQNDDTAFIEVEQSEYPDDYTGIYMDIMPIYGMPKAKILQCFASVTCDIFIFLNKVHRLPWCEQKSVKRKMAWILNIPLRRMKAFNYYIEIIEKIFGRYKFDSSDKVIFGWRNRPGWLHKKNTYQNVFFYDDFWEMKECPFEDTSIAVPCGYDRYLTMDFGDYMTLPPQEQRYPLHRAAIIDLNKSYKKYS